MIAAFTAFVVICGLVLGSMVLFKNPKNTINRSFFVYTLFMVLWSVSNYFADLPVNPLFWNRATFFSAALLAMSLYFFTIVFPAGSIKKHQKIYLIASLPAAFLSWTPGIVSGISERLSNGTVSGFNPSYGSLYVFFVVYFSAMLMIGMYHIFIKSRKLTGSKRVRVRYFGLGIGLAITIGLLTNVVLPSLANDSSSAKFAPLALLVLVTITSYAIIRHRLFNIRLVVARSLAFAFSIVTLGALYGAGLFLLSSVLLIRTENEWTENLVYLGLTIFLALTFSPFLNFYEKITKNLFYRGHYDVQEVLTRIGRVLESEIILDKLATKGITEICESLFIATGQIIIIDKDRIYKQWQHGSLPDKKLTLSQLQHLNQKLIIVDELSSGLRFDMLESQNARLSLLLSSKDEHIGYILLGDKLNGDIYTDDDVRLLEIIARDISVSIQNAKAYEKIALFNETLQARIKEATNELQRSNLKLKSIDESKDDFISMASHQLRTPLTSVKGFLSMVLEGDAGEINDAQRQMLQQAFISSQRMTFLIADLLNLSRLKTGKFLIDCQPTNLADVVSQEVLQLAETAKSRSLTLTYDYPKTFPTVLLDETKTRQVIMNFIDNAIYYTPHGGEIVVALKETESSVEFTVKDTGIGVAKSEQPKLFTKFYRADNAKRARPDGTGLGLFMAKKVIIAQGGSIIFKSEESKGSTFGFVLPKKTP